MGCAGCTNAEETTSDIDECPWGVAKTTTMFLIDFKSNSSVASEIETVAETLEPTVTTPESSW